MDTKRTAAEIRAAIRAARVDFIGSRSNRVAILEDTLEQLRADVVARCILVLEGQLEAALADEANAKAE